ncbi:MAG: hypothetical protein ACTSRU_14375 [Candidatus Hodarchaeales archaeon]
MSGEVVGQGATNAINKVFWCTEEVETSTKNRKKICTGFVSKSTGMVKVHLTDMKEPEEIYVIAGAHNIYNVKTMMVGSDVPITDIMLFWQGI